MDKEFVSYEQAVALKQLGFDEECFGYYVITTLLITTDNVYNSKEIPVIKAPLKQQVLRWFRKKYDAHIHPRRIMPNVYIAEYGLWASKVFNTYEEAENACIDKLIEIAKQQDK